MEAESTFHGGRVRANNRNVSVRISLRRSIHITRDPFDKTIQE